VKRYGAVRALNGVSLELYPGEILALLGDNGAGKSTLIKAISGVNRLDAGEIRIESRSVDIRSPAEARSLGIETVHQDLALFDNLSPVANFFAGREAVWPRFLGSFGLLRERAMRSEWEDLRNRLEVVIEDSTRQLGLMSGGQRQAVAVARAVAFAKRIVILDEPTAALGVRESRRVLDLIRRLPEAGISVILISHNLAQVGEVADWAVVLHQGVVAGDAAASAENHELLVSLIVGVSRRAEPSEASDTRAEDDSPPLRKGVR
jgi:ABC-type sugar transport system ATPase subunit